jgi:two-component system cell cycle sensor histidine kinase/response regulator CckA
MHDHGAREQADLRTLLERETRLRALMDAAFDGIVITQNGIIVEVSEALLELSGYARDEVVGRPVTDFIAPEFRETVGRRVFAGIEGRLDTVGMTKSGQRRRIAVVSRSHAGHGRTVRLTALRDVTEVRRLEDQLQQAQKMEALVRLASGVAHDFNNVLLIIRFFADMLLEDLEELDEPRRRVAREILRAVDSGAALARLLLAYARQKPVTPQLLNLNAVVRGSERLLRYLIGDGVRLTMDLAPDLAEVRADPTQLQQVILNLGINARDAMPQGGSLNLRTRNVEVGAVAPRARRYSVLLVSDSGSGMSNEVQAHMFDAFFTTKEPGEGTGLGLAIVHQIVERSGGFVSVESAAGVGTTFAIHLPHTDADH